MGKRSGAKPADPVWVSVEDAVRMTSIRRTSMYKLIKEGTIKSTRIGKRRLVSITSIQNLGTKQAALPKQAAPRSTTSTRIITQIVFANPFLWALCNDGTVWRYATSGTQTGWVRALDIPQDDRD